MKVGGRVCIRNYLSLSSGGLLIPWGKSPSSGEVISIRIWAIALPFNFRQHQNKQIFERFSECFLKTKIMLLAAFVKNLFIKRHYAIDPLKYHYFSLSAGSSLSINSQDSEEPRANWVNTTKRQLVIHNIIQAYYHHTFILSYFHTFILLYFYTQ